MHNRKQQSKPLSEPHTLVGYQNKALTCNGKNDFVVHTFRTVGTEGTAMTLGDLKATDDPDNEVYWDYCSDFLYTLKQNGLVEKTYAFLCATYAADIEGAPVGWYFDYDAAVDNFSEDTCQNNEVTFEPGQAFKVNASSDDMCLYIPSALGTK